MQQKVRVEDSQTEVRTDIKKERCVNILTGKKSSQAKEVQKRGYPREKGGGGGGRIACFPYKKANWQRRDINDK